MRSSQRTVAVSKDWRSCRNEKLRGSLRSRFRYPGEELQSVDSGHTLLFPALERFVDDVRDSAISTAGHDCAVPRVYDAPNHEAGLLEALGKENVDRVGNDGLDSLTNLGRYLFRILVQNDRSPVGRLAR